MDLILLIETQPLDLKILNEAIDKTFKFRATHPQPEFLEPPPLNWESRFQNLSKECGLDLSMQQAFEKIANFLQAV